MEPAQKWIHVGVDVVVPPGTRVAATWNGNVVHIDDDSPEIGGWGPRVLIQSEDEQHMIVIYAHLGEIFCKQGDRLKPGDVFATIGAPPFNGYWFPHLHIQAVNRKKYRRDWKSIVHAVDGYEHESLLLQLSEWFPDPMRFLRL